MNPILMVVKNTHRVIAVQGHTRRIEDKPRSSDELHSSLRWELLFERNLERALEQGLAEDV